MNPRWNPLRLLFIVTGLGGGGAENALLNLCRHIVAVRPNADIVVICLIGGVGGPIAVELRRLNVMVIALPDSSGCGGIARFVMEIAALIFFRPHVVQGWMYHGNVVAWWLRNLMFPGARLAGSVHSLWSQPKHVSVVLQAARGLNLLGARLDIQHTFYAGRASLEQHVGVGFPREMSSVLPNGVQFDSPGAAVESGEIETTAVPILVHVSRAHLDKDNENFIRTVALLEARQFRCDIVVLGAGLDAGFMRRGLPGYEAYRYVKVEALGFRTDIRTFLRKASVVFLSSKSEAFPVSLVEALGVGAVCVATDVGDCRAIIGDCGRTVPSGRPDLLAEALVEWANKSHRNRAGWASRCRARAMEHFSLETMGRLYARLFTDLEQVRVL